MPNFEYILTGIVWTLSGLIMPLAPVVVIPAITYSIHTGELPTGLSINASTGIITGIPTVKAEFNVTIRGVNPLGMRDVDITFSESMFAISTTTNVRGRISTTGMTGRK